MSAAELGSTDAVAAIGVFHGDALSNGTGPPEPDNGNGNGVVVLVVSVGVGVVDVIVVSVGAGAGESVSTTSWGAVAAPASLEASSIVFVLPVLRAIETGPD
jgi:hypothetical protein